ncbi:MAG: hypothetical protein P8Y63_06960 [Deltaproteobacteria bacterium]
MNGALTHSEWRTTVRERWPAALKTAAHELTPLYDVSDWVEHRFVIFCSFLLETRITKGM